MFEEREYICSNYLKTPEFASFLPGIAGISGIPLWCYYVNRGQGVVSFGSENKDNAIMEFYPAQVAYQRVSVTGFRTFLRADGAYAEPFSDPEVPHEMRIRMNSFDVSERNEKTGLETKALYYILPEENYGALVRRLSVTNISGGTVSLEIADGMPQLIPYGVDDDTMKNMTQLAKAWMQVEDAQSGVPFYRVRASMADTASVQEVKGGNFCLGVDEKGETLPVLVDGRVLFGYDTSLAKARVFMEGGLDAVLSGEQACSNQFPCAFFTARRTLAPGETAVFYELYGHAGSREKLAEITRQMPAPAWLEEKYILSGEITKSLGDTIDTRTANPDFDAYSRYTYMDNVLRGGWPVEAGGKVFYVYSRKHGDLEREYNFFSMSPEPCSQGNGNFRDVNQNRRCDPFFTPAAGRKNIHLFYDLIQPDGYNPLSVEKITYVVEPEMIPELASGLSALGQNAQALLEMVSEPFTPGRLYVEIRSLLKKYGKDHVSEYTEEIFRSVLAASRELQNASFKEGYWTDHWTYNLDLIEEYLGIWPEQEEDLLTEKTCTWYRPEANVNPRAKRYVKTEDGIRQYNAVTPVPDAQPGQIVTTPRGERPCVSTLFEKLTAMCAIKTATLDPLGMGIEMEGGKPGWFDALNGLPGLLGSSMNESCELARMLRYTTGALRRHPGKLELYTEIRDLTVKVEKILTEGERGRKAAAERDDAWYTARWQKLSDARESYRESVSRGFSGRTVTVKRDELADTLDIFREAVESGIRRSIAAGGSGIIPSYFYYEVTDHSENKDGIAIKAVRQHAVPLFLEGPTRYLKLPLEKDERQDLYRKIKESGLYDEKLSMYKVCDSLQDASYEIGRVKCFTPGWLENESIWLHMEYKYLLELLRSGLYPEFAQDLKSACIPFLDEETYGRSILENSSFIVSSANPDKSLHGRGFVARLSGSTAEFLSIWQIMMFGAAPFAADGGKGKLTARFAPVMPEYLIADDLTVTAMFMGHTPVTYHFDQKADYFPGGYRVEKIVLVSPEGARQTIEAASDTEDAVLKGKLAEAWRAGVLDEADVYLRKE